jgi:hypothetical protein
LAAGPGVFFSLFVYFNCAFLLSYGQFNRLLFESSLNP